MQDVTEILTGLITRHPELEECRQSVDDAFKLMCKSLESGGKLLLCGNGGSCADCDHIAGELLKGFCRSRPLTREQKNFLHSLGSVRGECLAAKLQRALPVVNLCSHTALMTAVANDTDANLIFAQQIMGLGRPGDVLICICPKGFAENVLDAIVAARLQGMKVLGLTSRSGGAMRDLCDVRIGVPEDEVYLTQEQHLPIYHALCLMLEAHFFEE